MNTLPLCLENLVLDYKYQLEHTEKFKKTLTKIKKITHYYNNHSDKNYGSILYEKDKAFIYLWIHNNNTNDYNDNNILEVCDMFGHPTKFIQDNKIYYIEDVEFI